MRHLQRKKLSSQAWKRIFIAIDTKGQDDLLKIYRLLEEQCLLNPSNELTLSDNQDISRLV